MYKIYIIISLFLYFIFFTQVIFSRLYFSGKRHPAKNKLIHPRHALGRNVLREQTSSLGMKFFGFLNLLALPYIAFTEPRTIPISARTVSVLFSFKLFVVFLLSQNRHFLE